MMTSSKPKSRLEWWEPRWSYAQRFRPLRKHLTPKRLALHAAWISTALLIFVLLFNEYLEPFLSWSAILKMTMSGGAAVVLSTFWTDGLQFLVPKYVELRPKKIRLVFFGDFSAKADDIESIRLAVFAPGIVRMRITYIKENALYTQKLPVGSDIDLVMLSFLSPVKPIVWDARRKFARLHRPQPRNPYQWHGRQ